MRKIALLLIVVCLGLAGCNSSELTELKANLGPWQYIGTDPKVSFTITTAEFMGGEGKYDSPKVKFTVSAKQTNPDFKLTKYKLGIPVEVVDGKGSKRYEFHVIADVENGVTSASDIQTMYSLKLADEAELRSLKLQITEYDWFPSTKLKPVTPTSVR